MAFVRTKVIKGKSYAYLVENKWTPKGSRQNSKKYLGRVFLLQKVRDQTSLNLEKYLLNGKTKKELLEEAIWFALKDYGFTRKKAKLKQKDIIVDLEKMNVLRRGRPVALAISEGILCTETLNRILNYEESEEKTEGYILAKYCVEAGLALPQQLFISLYEVSRKSLK